MLSSPSMIHGYVHDAFRPVAKELLRQLTFPNAGGAAVCVYYRGVPVVDAWAGARNASGEPWESGTMALSFSTTKGVMATLVALLVDRGMLDYDDPIARYWPEFGQQGKEQITLRQIMSHQAGLYVIRSLIDHGDRMLDWEHMTAAIAKARPIASPYGRCGYHGLTYGWLVGEVVRRVTGMRVRDALQTLIAEPLGLDGLYLGAPESERGRLAMLLAPSTRTPTAWNRFTYWLLRRTVALCGLDPERTRSALLPHGGLDVFFSTRVLDAEIPAFNGVFTARSLARMYAMLAAGGVLDGTRFISEETIRRATQVHGRGLDNVVGFPMRWRLGYHFVGTHRGVLQNAFGHFGYGGSGAWADPDRDMSMALTLNRVAGTPFGDMRMVILSGIAARCADLARRRGILQAAPFAKSA